MRYKLYRKKFVGNDTQGISNISSPVRGRKKRKRRVVGRAIMNALREKQPMIATDLHEEVNKNLEKRVSDSTFYENLDTLKYLTAVRQLSDDRWVLYDYEEPTLELLYEPENNPALYTPELDVMDRSSNGSLVKVGRRKYVNVVARSKGKSVRGIEGFLTVIERPEGCEAPSGEPKGLKWKRREPFEKIDLPKKGEDILEVLFTQEGLESEWHGEHRWGPIKAWIAAHEGLRLSNGLCKGKYRIKIKVYSENMDPIAREFEVYVGQNWKEILFSALT